MSLRTQKPPSRRQLAAKLAEAIPVINSQSSNVDALHAELSALRSVVVTLGATVQNPSFLGRVKWLVKGA